MIGLLEEGAADGSLRAVQDPAATASALFGAVAIAALQSLVVDGELDAEAPGASLIGLVLDGLGVD